MANKSVTPDYNKRIVVPDGQKGYTGHKLPAQPPATPPPTSQPNSGPTPSPSPQPSDSGKK